MMLNVAKKLPVLLGVILAVSVFIAATTIALHWSSYDLGYFEKAYIRYGIPADLEVSLADLMGYSVLLTDYLRGNNDDPNVVTTVRGETGPLYGEREIMHLEDVRDLFDLSRLLRNVSLLVSLGIFAYALVRKELPACLLGALYGGFGLVVVLALLALLAWTDFERYFVIFHELSFSNDLWMLDPNTENLIRMFPEPFFSGMAMRIFLAMAGSYTAFLGVCKWSLAKNLIPGLQTPAKGR